MSSGLTYIESVHGPGWRNRWNTLLNRADMSWLCSEISKLNKVAPNGTSACWKTSQWGHTFSCTQTHDLLSPISLLPNSPVLRLLTCLITRRFRRNPSVVSRPNRHQQHWSHVSLLVIINHPHVILTSWTNKMMEYVSGQPPAFHLWIPGHCLPARKRASQKALQPIKNVLKHKIYNAAHIPTELRFHFTSWVLAKQQSL